MNVSAMNWIAASDSAAFVDPTVALVAVAAALVAVAAACVWLAVGARDARGRLERIHDVIHVGTPALMDGLHAGLARDVAGARDEVNAATVAAVGRAEQALHAALAQEVGKLSKALDQSTVSPKALARAVQEMELAEQLGGGGGAAAGEQKDLVGQIRTHLERLGWKRVKAGAGAGAVRDVPFAFDAKAGAGLGAAGWKAPKDGDDVPGVALRSAADLAALKAEVDAIRAESGVELPAAQAGMIPVSALGSWLQAVGATLDQHASRATIDRAGAIARCAGRWRAFLVAGCGWKPLTAVATGARAADAVPAPIRVVTGYVEADRPVMETVPGARGSTGMLPALELVQMIRPSTVRWWESRGAATLANAGMQGERERLQVMIDALVCRSAATFLEPVSAVAQAALRGEVWRGLAGVLLGVRADALRGRLARGVLVPADFEVWDEMTAAVDSDLNRVGLRVASDAEVARLSAGGERAAAFPWGVPPEFVGVVGDGRADGDGAGPRAVGRWLRPPILPKAGSAAVEGAELARGEYAEPTAVGDRWKIPVMRLLWQGGAVPAAARRSANDVLAAVDEIESSRMSADGEVSAELQNRVICGYWEPLFRLVSHRPGLAVGGRLSAAGEEWVSGINDALARVNLVCVPEEREAKYYDDAGPAAGGPRWRPPLVDAETRECRCVGLRERGAEAGRDVGVSGETQY